MTFSWRAGAKGVGLNKKMKHFKQSKSWKRIYCVVDAVGVIIVIADFLFTNKTQKQLPGGVLLKKCS